MSRQSPLPIAADCGLLYHLSRMSSAAAFLFPRRSRTFPTIRGWPPKSNIPTWNPALLATCKGPIRPFSLQNNQPKEVWDLKLEDAIRNALTNNKIMRTIGGQVQGPPDFISAMPEQVPSIYDPALVESNPRSGVEAALSAFDTQFSIKLCLGQDRHAVDHIFSRLLSAIAPLESHARHQLLSRPNCKRRTPRAEHFHSATSPVTASKT